ncbi:hypothetical protein [Arthrobacter sp. VKM Ac-2550]|uniref:hypothetical protein n=1 Tax=Crystallibacter permensis TaxID=1938888 RepID=UPI0022270981|nr:hypothetical protein [Arthrobacter sp. VKM Ac-2550]MCW2135408.1 hypothetical protein [Arthrobacter sp. VKM Ac-2550]
MLISAAVETTIAIEAMPITDWITAWATVGALILSAVLGFVSIKLTLADRHERRTAERLQHTKVFGFGDLKADHVLVRVVNATEFPVRNINVLFFGYMSSPVLKVIHSGSQFGLPLLAPGKRKTLRLDFERHPDLADMNGYVGVRLQFIDIHGQSWVRKPNGHIVTREELGTDPGFDLPRDHYTYEGPHVGD